MRRRGRTPPEVFGEGHVVEVHDAPVLVRFRVSTSAVGDERDLEDHEKPEGNDEQTHPHASLNPAARLCSSVFSHRNRLNFGKTAGCRRDFFYVPDVLDLRQCQSRKQPFSSRWSFFQDLSQGVLKAKKHRSRTVQAPSAPSHGTLRSLICPPTRFRNGEVK